jgi:hypothetical protein
MCCRYKISCDLCKSNRSGSLRRDLPSPNFSSSAFLALSSAEPPRSRLSIQNFSFRTINIFFTTNLSPRHECTFPYIQSIRTRHTPRQQRKEKSQIEKEGKRHKATPPSCRRCAMQYRGATTKSVPNRSNARNGVFWRKKRFVYPPRSIPFYLYRFYTKTRYFTSLRDGTRESEKDSSLTYISKGLHPQSQRPQ